MKTQTIVAKQGEVSYRAQISVQHLGKKVMFPNEPTKSEFLAVVRPKIKETEKVFKDLKVKGVNLTPYLEIGAEYGIRSSLLESNFDGIGFATDISLYSLAKATQFAKKFGFGKVAKTVCADAYNLPFRSNSFPFIFVYETLHHFPDPKPVLTEIKRVLATNGTLLIGSDPVSSVFQVRVWRRPTKLRLGEKILKFFLILPFISHIGKTEVDHGILEETFSLKTWQRALSIFDAVKVKIRVFPVGPTETITKSNKKDWLSPSLTTKALLAFLGGDIQAICSKKNGKPNFPFKDLDSLIICPDCLAKDRLKIPLTINPKSGFVCRRCNSGFKKKNGVLVILEKLLEKKLLG